MSRILGVLILLGTLYVLLLARYPEASRADNLLNIANSTGFFGILTLGVGVVIITGGIDLSIGSVVALSAVGFVMLMRDGVSPHVATLIVLAGGVVIGLVHGLLITQLGLQPFLVTLCGLFVYRGLARLLTDRDLGLTEVLRGGPQTPAHPHFEGPLESLRFWLYGVSEGRLEFPAELYLMLGVALLVWYLLHGSVYGRYIYAIGHNEQAARYAGIRTTRYKIFAYVFCSLMASVGGVLYMLENRTVSPANAAQLYELYAITGAVLGGCSLRGGEGTVLGILLGAAVMPVLRNLIIFAAIPDAAEYAIIGMALLLGTIADQFFRRRGAGRT